MKLDKFVAITDPHGNYVAEPAWAAMTTFVKHFKPQHRIHLGDAFNFASLRKGASDEEKRERLAPDIDRGIALIKEFKPTVFLRGNHDERMWDLFKGDDEKSSRFAASMIVEIEDALKGVQTLPYDKRRGVYKFHDYSLLHGYHSGLYAAMNAARVYGNCLMGHNHAVDAQSAPRYEGATGRCIGCLCQLDQTYNRAHANTIRQGHGFAYGFVVGGKLNVFQAQPIGGKWVFPTEFTTL